MELPGGADLECEGVEGAVVRVIPPAEVRGPGSARDQRVAGAVHGDAMARILAAPAEVVHPLDLRVDHERQRRVGRGVEGDRVGVLIERLEARGDGGNTLTPALSKGERGKDALNPGHIPGAGSVPLPHERRAVAQCAEGCLDQQIARSFVDAQRVDAVVANADPRVVGAGVAVELVLEHAGVAAEHVQIDAVVEILVNDRRERRHVAGPLRFIVADVVVEARRLRHGADRLHHVRAGEGDFEDERPVVDRMKTLTLPSPKGRGCQKALTLPSPKERGCQKRILCVFSVVNLLLPPQVHGERRLAEGDVHPPAPEAVHDRTVRPLPPVWHEVDAAQGEPDPLAPNPLGPDLLEPDLRGRGGHEPHGGCNGQCAL